MSTIKTLKKGKNNWRPWGIPWPLFLPMMKGIKYTVRFDKSCWYNWLPDTDHYDINKGGGFTEMFSLNNANSYLWGWNSDETEQGVFNIYAYYNAPDTSFKFEKIGKVKAGEDFDVQVLTSGKIVILTQEAEAFHQFEEPGFKVARMITEWFGGANNSPGPYGGSASQDMEMVIKKSIIR